MDSRRRKENQGKTEDFADGILLHRREIRDKIEWREPGNFLGRMETQGKI